MNNYNYNAPGAYPPAGPPPFGPYMRFDDDGYRPFRKRHPVLFTFIVLALLGGLGLAFASCMRVMLDDDTLGTLGGKHLGVIYVEGIILESTDVVDWARKLEESDNVLGVLVHINSPGGAVTPSEEIYFAIERLAAKKPVVASMGTLAASGGYMIALPAQKIVAAPSSITGSIGTRIDMANWAELMDKIGIKDQSLTSGRMKDAGSPYRDMSEEERAYFTGMLTDMHEHFKELVMKARGLTQEQVDAVADGRAFTGRQAHELGLVDALGDKYSALQTLNAFTGNEAAGNTLLEGPPKRLSLYDQIFESMFRAWHQAQIKIGYDRPLFYF